MNRGSPMFCYEHWVERGSAGVLRHDGLCSLKRPSFLQLCWDRAGGAVVREPPHDTSDCAVLAFMVPETRQLYC